MHRNRSQNFQIGFAESERETEIELTSEPAHKNFVVW